jgi:hypothetical protein
MDGMSERNQAFKRKEVMTHGIAFARGDAVQAFGEVMEVGCEVLGGKVGWNGANEEVDPGAEDLVALLLRQAVAITTIPAVVVSVTCKRVCQDHITGQHGEERDGEKGFEHFELWRIKYCDNLIMLLMGGASTQEYPNRLSVTPELELAGDCTTSYASFALSLLSSMRTGHHLTSR